MISKIMKRLWKNELMRGSLILTILFGLFNLMNFIFHFISGRLLGEVYYGILGAIMGIIYIFSIPSETIQTIMSRYTTKFLDNKEKIKGFLAIGLKKFFYFGIISFIIFIMVSPLLSKFLSIDIFMLILIGFFLVIVFVSAVNRGVLQGVKRFSTLGFNFFSEGIIKLGLVTVFILIGWKVYGAILGIIIAGLFAFLVAFISLKDIIKVKADKNVETKGIRSYSIPVLISIASITFFYASDLILARGFFPELAGQYVAISMISKIIFFGTMPISKAMFPIISERQEKKKKSTGILKRTLLFIGILSAFALIFYYLFPELIISILYGGEFIKLAPFILLPSVSMTLLSFSNVFVYHNMATDKEKRNYFLIIFVLIQLILPSIFHSTILQFMLMNIIANIILLVFLIIFSFRK